MMEAISVAPTMETRDAPVLHLLLIMTLASLAFSGNREHGLLSGPLPVDPREARGRSLWRSRADARRQRKTDRSRPGENGPNLADGSGPVSIGRGADHLGPGLSRPVTGDLHQPFGDAAAPARRPVAAVDLVIVKLVSLGGQHVAQTQVAHEDRGAVERRRDDLDGAGLQDEADRQLARALVTLEDPLVIGVVARRPLFVTLDAAPVDRRVAGQDAQPLLLRQRPVHVADGGEPPGVDRRLPRGDLGRVAPDLKEIGDRDVLAADVAIEDRLALPARELDDDVGRQRLE